MTSESGLDPRQVDPVNLDESTLIAEHGATQLGDDSPLVLASVDVVEVLRHEPVWVLWYTSRHASVSADSSWPSIEAEAGGH